MKVKIIILSSGLKRTKKNNRLWPLAQKVETTYQLRFANVADVVYVNVDVNLQRLYNNCTGIIGLRT